MSNKKKLKKRSKKCSVNPDGPKHELITHDKITLCIWCHQ